MLTRVNHAHMIFPDGNDIKSPRDRDMCRILATPICILTLHAMIRSRYVMCCHGNQAIDYIRSWKYVYSITTCCYLFHHQLKFKVKHERISIFISREIRPNMCSEIIWATRSSEVLDIPRDFFFWKESWWLCFYFRVY